MQRQEQELTTGLVDHRDGYTIVRGKLLEYLVEFLNAADLLVLELSNDVIGSESQLAG